VSYRVRTDVFEGPFDLLLHLVSKQKVEVTDIDICEVADQYLEHIERMKELDLDVASDFLLVAATLLEMKAASILPTEREPGEPDEYEDMSPEEARKLLIARLLAYKTFKNASAELAARNEAEARMHPRQAGLEERFLKLMPDYLEGITLRSLGVICADLLARREVFLLEAEHVAAMPISLELHVRYVANLLGAKGRKLFSELVASGADAEEIVVTFLAILELYKRGLVDLKQEDVFGDIEITNVEEA
jgi:segregation and condensation protein A